MFKSQRALSTHIQHSHSCNMVYKHGAKSLPPSSVYSLVVPTDSSETSVLTNNMHTTNATPTPLGHNNNTSGSTANLPTTIDSNTYTSQQPSNDTINGNGSDDEPNMDMLVDLNDNSNVNPPNANTNATTEHHYNTNTICALKTNTFRMSKEDEMCTDLLHVLLKNGAPLSTFDIIMSWVKDASMKGISFDSKILTRATIMKHLEKKFNTECCKPKTLTYNIEGGGTEEVILFDFISMFTSLLSGSRLMQPSNLVIDVSQPSCFQDKYKLNDNLDELHQGSVCRDSIQKLCKDEKDIFCGIVLYTDGTQLGQFVKGTLEPVMFTLSIFNRETRNQSYAWRPLGFLKKPNDVVRNNTETQEDLKGRPVRNYHRALRYVLSGIKHYQEHGGIQCDLDLCGHFHKNVTFKIPIICMICDCETADVACGRYRSHAEGVNLVCRDCDCPTSEADNYAFPCNLRKSADFHNKTQDELQQLSHYRLDNVFDELLMCDEKHGIHCATPPEILHWKNAGLDKLSATHFFEKVLGKGQTGILFDAALAKVS